MSDFNVYLIMCVFMVVKFFDWLGVGLVLLEFSAVYLLVKPCDYLVIIHFAQFPFFCQVGVLINIITSVDVGGKSRMHLAMVCAVFGYDWCEEQA